MIIKKNKKHTHTQITVCLEQQIYASKFFLHNRWLWLLRHLEGLMSRVICHMSHVTCHQHQQPKPHTPAPLLTPSLCTIDWLAKTDMLVLARFWEGNTLQHISFIVDYLLVLWVYCSCGGQLVGHSSAQTQLLTPNIRNYYFTLQPFLGVLIIDNVNNINCLTFWSQNLNKGN